MENKKVLFFLDASKPVNRVIRRAVMIFIFAGISAVIQNFIAGSPEWFTPILTMILAALDKMLREEKTPQV